MNDLDFLKYLTEELPPLTFGSILYQEPEDDTCAVISIDDVAADAFAAFGAALVQKGFQSISSHSFGEAAFTTFTKDTLALYVSYYPTVQQLRIVGEQNSPYLSLQPEKAHYTGAPSLLTQLELQDFGMSYLIRLSDGRFLVFDGGWDFEPDADHLMEELYRQSSDEIPRVAAWIFTHPHIDHYRCFLVFSEKYAGQFIVERFLYNFPPITDTIGEKAEDLAKELPYLRRLESVISELGTPVYRPHTGQSYQFANARLEILSSLDDTCLYPSDGNTLSLVIKVMIDNQTILFCGDADLTPALLAERYGNYLKSDLLQVAHHGFHGGTTLCHKLINPSVCLVPCLDYDFYKTIDVHYEWIQTLLYDLDVREIFTGGDSTGANVVLELPYTPRPNGKLLYLQKLRASQKEMGSTSWFFADMTAEDCRFSLLNTTINKPNVYATLYTDNSAERVTHIKLPLKAVAITNVDFATGEGIEDDALFFNRTSLAKKGFPAGKPFTVHIHSDQPIVVWCSKEPVYHA